MKTSLNSSSLLLLTIVHSSLFRITDLYHYLSRVHTINLTYSIERFYLQKKEKEKYF